MKIIIHYRLERGDTICFHLLEISFCKKKKEKSFLPLQLQISFQTRNEKAEQKYQRSMSFLEEPSAELKH